MIVLVPRSSENETITAISIITSIHNSEFETNEMVTVTSTILSIEESEFESNEMVTVTSFIEINEPLTSKQMKRLQFEVVWNEVVTATSINNSIVHSEIKCNELYKKERSPEGLVKK